MRPREFFAEIDAAVVWPLAARAASAIACCGRGEHEVRRLDHSKLPRRWILLIGRRGHRLLGVIVIVSGGLRISRTPGASGAMNSILRRSARSTDDAEARQRRVEGQNGQVDLTFANTTSYVFQPLIQHLLEGA
jgi:hypothetical protein